MPLWPDALGRFVASKSTHVAARRPRRWRPSIGGQRVANWLASAARASWSGKIQAATSCAGRPAGRADGQAGGQAGRRTDRRADRARVSRPLPFDVENTSGTATLATRRHYESHIFITRCICLRAGFCLRRRVYVAEVPKLRHSHYFCTNWRETKADIQPGGESLCLSSARQLARQHASQTACSFASLPSTVPIVKTWKTLESVFIFAR